MCVRTRVLCRGLGVAASLPMWGESMTRTHRSTASLLDGTNHVQSKADTEAGRGSDQRGGEGRGAAGRRRGGRDKHRLSGGRGSGLALCWASLQTGMQLSLRPRRPALSSQVLGGEGGQRGPCCVGAGLGRARVSGALVGSEPRWRCLGHLTAPSLCSSLLPLKSSPFFFLEDTPLPLPGPPAPTAGAGGPAWRWAVGDGALLAGPAPSGGTWWYR